MDGAVLHKQRSEVSELTWGYDEGMEWGPLFPDANGENQSPININSREATFDPSLLTAPLCLSYLTCRECEVLNDGHSLHIHIRSKSVTTGGPFPIGQEFELSHVCFHWGKEDQRGSEHTVNFKAFPMECHLIHWNATLYKNIEDAMGKENGIAIIALFVQIGREHLGLKGLTDILQEIQYKGKAKTIPSFNPNTLLPEMPPRDRLRPNPARPALESSPPTTVIKTNTHSKYPLLRDYWVYEGSLTTPPCCEHVLWLLFRYPLTLSHAQIEEFRRLRTHSKGVAPSDGCDGQLGDNFRPTQQLNDRVIRASFP